MEKVVRFKLHKHKKQWLTIGVVTVAGVVISVTTTTQVSANTERNQRLLLRRHLLS